jgi:hypothetical protein
MYFIIKPVLSTSLTKKEMTKTNTIDFHPSITRFYLFFAALFQWFKIIIGIKSSSQPNQVIENNPTPISQKDTYIERNKSRFLLTYDVTSKCDWNANIEPEIKDPTQMAKILTDPNNELEKNWRTRVLIENTPRGNVIMFYDIYKRGFSYYCDNSVMPYEIMNAVAMKYVLTFHCREFFIDDSVLPKKEKREEDDPVPLKNLNKNVALQDKQAFVKYKTYNTATKKAGVSPADDKMINCFLHLGGVRNWTPIPKKVKANPLNGFQTDMMPGTNNNKLSYLEYKKRLVDASK